MKIYEIIFFHVFKRYYKNGEYKDDIPWLTASSIIGISAFFYFISIYDCVYFVIYGNIASLSKTIFLPIGFTIVIFNLLFFIYNDRYLIIYNAYKEKYDKDIVTDVLAWAYVLGSLVFYISTIIIFRC